KGTFDSYLWQIQEQKLRYITQVMSGKSIARSCEDMDETVLTAAEVKAIATDNPMLAEKMEVDNEVARLKLLRGSWQNEHAVLERNINQYYPESIAHHRSNIKKISADVELLRKTEGRDFQITIDGRTFNERVPAGERLMLLSRLDDSKEKDTPLSVGEYRGLALALEHGAFDSLQFTLKGSHTYRGDLGSSELGAITRIENAADQIAKLLSNEKDELANFERQLTEAKKEVVMPFEYEQRLSEYAARQSEINTSLEFQELQKQEDVILDENSETEEGENANIKEESVCVGAEVE
ncbi:MAG TPA: helicase, partial [Clostridia bacterium]|nr:helicase [Clostridia bacterium]